MPKHKTSLIFCAILMAFSITMVIAATKPKVFNIQTSQFKFTPSTITVNQNDHVRLIVTSKDVPHGIYIKAYKINVPFKKGEKKVINFVANKKGTFPILCSVYCGSGHHDMTGKLIVK